MALGAIGTTVSGIIPVTFDMLNGDSRFGEAKIQGRVDLVKQRLFGEVVPPAEEEDYHPLVKDYAAKLAAIELLTAGIDMWSDQPISKNTSGTSEVITWEERLQKMQEQRTYLIAETRRLAPDIALLIEYQPITSRGIPGLSTMEDPLITPDPQTFPVPYAPA